MAAGSPETVVTSRPQRTRKAPKRAGELGDDPATAAPRAKRSRGLAGLLRAGSMVEPSSQEQSSREHLRRVDFVMSATDDVTSLACTPRTRPSSLGDTAPSDARKSRRLSTKVKLDYAAIDNANAPA